MFRMEVDSMRTTALRYFALSAWMSMSFPPVGGVSPAGGFSLASTVNNEQKSNPGTIVAAALVKLRFIRIPLKSVVAGFLFRCTI
jgi:hypothetical protein